MYPVIASVWNMGESREIGCLGMFGWCIVVGASLLSSHRIRPRRECHSSHPGLLGGFLRVRPVVEKAFGPSRLLPQLPEFDDCIHTLFQILWHIKFTRPFLNIFTDIPNTLDSHTPWKNHGDGTFGPWKMVSTASMFVQPSPGSQSAVSQRGKHSFYACTHAYSWNVEFFLKPGRNINLTWYNMIMNKDIYIPEPWNILQQFVDRQCLDQFGPIHQCSIPRPQPSQPPPTSSASFF